MHTFKFMLGAMLASTIAASPLSFANLELWRRSNLLERATSPEGICGGSTGYTCATGYCCSQYGYCGVGPSHCGTTTMAKSTSTSKSISASKSTSTSKPASASASKSTSASTSTSKSTSTSTATASTQKTPLAGRTATQTSSATTVTSTGAVSTGLGDTYTFYSGSGTVAAGWPAQNEWVDFNTMWNNNQVLITRSCAEFNNATVTLPEDSSAEIADILSAINTESSVTGVDNRFILAIIMQESKGCVRAPTTNYGVRNPGLMQDHDGTGTCNDDVVVSPCPASEITQMIQDGTAGTATGDGLEQCLAAADCTDVSQYYKAARIYNSGSIDSSGDLGKGIATHCYSSDVANRLTGWVQAATKCTLDD